MYKLSYDDRVEDDINKLGDTIYIMIKQSIEKKLLSNPIVFSKPLSNKLKNLRSLRVSDYRVIFKLKDDIVFICAIGHRRSIYELALKRFR